MTVRIVEGDALASLRALPDCSVQTCITSPPCYGLRDYGVPGQIGLEATPAEFVARLVDVFREINPEYAAMARRRIDGDVGHVSRTRALFAETGT